MNTNKNSVLFSHLMSSFFPFFQSLNRSSVIKIEQRSLAKDYTELAKDIVAHASIDITKLVHCVTRFSLKMNQRWHRLSDEERWGCNGCQGRWSSRYWQSCAWCYETVPELVSTDADDAVEGNLFDRFIALVSGPSSRCSVPCQQHDQRCGYGSL